MAEPDFVGDCDRLCDWTGNPPGTAADSSSDSCCSASSSKPSNTPKTISSRVEAVDFLDMPGFSEPASRAMFTLERSVGLAFDLTPDPSAMTNACCFPLSDEALPLDGLRWTLAFTGEEGGEGMVSERLLMGALESTEMDIVVVISTWPMARWFEGGLKEMNRLVISSV